MGEQSSTVIWQIVYFEVSVLYTAHILFITHLIISHMGEHLDTVIINRLIAGFADSNCLQVFQRFVYAEVTVSDTAHI